MHHRNKSSAARCRSSVRNPAARPGVTAAMPDPAPAAAADALPDGHDALHAWRMAARPCTPGRLFGRARSLGVIVPHADDETLGCGGLIACAAARGIDVTVTVLTDGAASHPGSRQWPPARLAQQRRREARAAVARLSDGRARVQFGDAADGRLDDDPALAAAIPGAELYVSCWRGDPHPDHRAAYAIARRAAARGDVRLLSFPLWVLTTALAPPPVVLRADVGGYLARKQAALAQHRSQLGQLVTDVAGFALDAALIALFVRADELFVEEWPGRAGAAVADCAAPPEQ